MDKIIEKILSDKSNYNKIKEKFAKETSDYIAKMEEEKPTEYVQYQKVVTDFLLSNLFKSVSRKDTVHTFDYLKIGNDNVLFRDIVRCDYSLFYIEFLNSLATFKNMDTVKEKLLDSFDTFVDNINILSLIPKKCIFVINGVGGVGKDTLINSLSVSASNISSIDFVKDCAISLGWDGVKDTAGRKLLSDLKSALTKYDDLPFKDIKKRTDEWMTNFSSDILFVHIREPKEIDKYVDWAEKYYSDRDINIYTLLIAPYNLSVARKMEKIGNKSDDSVYEYNYDLVFINEKTGNSISAEQIDSFNKLILDKVGY